MAFLWLPDHIARCHQMGHQWIILSILGGLLLDDGDHGQCPLVRSDNESRLKRE